MTLEDMKLPEDMTHGELEERLLTVMGEVQQLRSTLELQRAISRDRSARIEELRKQIEDRDRAILQHNRMVHHDERDLIVNDGPTLPLWPDR